jgi:hypothetical protein
MFNGVYIQYRSVSLMLKNDMYRNMRQIRSINRLISIHNKECPPTEAPKQGKDCHVNKITAPYRCHGIEDMDLSKRGSAG